MFMTATGKREERKRILRRTTKRTVRMLALISTLAVASLRAFAFDDTEQDSIGTEYTITAKELHNLSGTMIVLGDSIWGLDKTDTGIAACLEEITSLQIKNYCIPGSSATYRKGTYYADDSLLSLLIYHQDSDSETIQNDIKAADYVILQHGLNDYFQGVPASYADGKEQSYEYAIQTAIDTVQEMNPESVIILLAPTNCYFRSLDALASEADMGGGKLGDYTEIMKKLAEKEQVICIDMQEAWELTRENEEEYLLDGIHLKEEACERYSDYLAETLYDKLLNCE